MNYANIRVLNWSEPLGLGSIFCSLIHWVGLIIVAIGQGWMLLINRLKGTVMAGVLALLVVLLMFNFPAWERLMSLRWIVGVWAALEKILLCLHLLICSESHENVPEDYVMAKSPEGKVVVVGAGEPCPGWIFMVILLGIYNEAIL